MRGPGSSFSQILVTDQYFPVAFMISLWMLW